jgi:hypothetical protein
MLPDRPTNVPDFKVILDTTAPPGNMLPVLARLLLKLAQRRLHEQAEPPLRRPLPPDIAGR